jgi:hypothetical protein
MDVVMPSVLLIVVTQHNHQALKKRPAHVHRSLNVSYQASP